MRDLQLRRTGRPITPSYTSITSLTISEGQLYFQADGYYVLFDPERRLTVQRWPMSLEGGVAIVVQAPSAVPGMCVSKHDLYQTPKFLPRERIAIRLPGRPQFECDPYTGEFETRQCVGVVCFCVDRTSGRVAAASESLLWDAVECGDRAWEYGRAAFPDLPEEGDAVEPTDPVVEEVTETEIIETEENKGDDMNKGDTMDKEDSRDKEDDMTKGDKMDKGDGTVVANGKKYTYYPNAMAYFSAQNTCRGLGYGGSLACPANAAQNRAIMSAIAQSRGQLEMFLLHFYWNVVLTPIVLYRDPVWLGVHDMINEGQFRCISGKALSYNNMRDESSNEEDQDFVVMEPTTGDWAAKGSFKYPFSFAFVCEVPCESGQDCTGEDPTCEGDLVYQECACPVTCADMVAGATCRSCNPGCGCPEDRPLLQDGRCVARSECPKPTCSTPGARWTDCGNEPSCDSTCLNAGDMIACTKNCVPRCQCPRAAPLTMNGQCVGEMACPKEMGVKFALSTTAATYSEARVSCIHNGGALACVRTTEQRDVLLQYVIQGETWVGMRNGGGCLAREDSYSVLSGATGSQFGLLRSGDLTPRSPDTSLPFICELPCDMATEGSSCYSLTEPEPTESTTRPSGPGHMFFLRPKATYLGAITDCMGNGGVLACPRNWEQQRAIQELIGGEDTWLGVNDMMAEGVFSCTTGNPAVFKNFKVAPDNMANVLTTVFAKEMRIGSGQCSDTCDMATEAACIPSYDQENTEPVVGGDDMEDKTSDNMGDKDMSDTTGDMEDRTGDMKEDKTKMGDKDGIAGLKRWSYNWDGEVLTTTVNGVTTDTDLSDYSDVTISTDNFAVYAVSPSEELVQFSWGSGVFDRRVIKSNVMQIVLVGSKLYYIKWGQIGTYDLNTRESRVVLDRVYPDRDSFQVGSLGRFSFSSQSTLYLVEGGEQRELVRLERGDSTPVYIGGVVYVLRNGDLIRIVPGTGEMTTVETEIRRFRVVQGMIIYQKSNNKVYLYSNDGNTVSLGYSFTNTPTGDLASLTGRSVLQLDDGTILVGYLNENTWQRISRPGPLAVSGSTVYYISREGALMAEEISSGEATRMETMDWSRGVQGMDLREGKLYITSGGSVYVMDTETHEMRTLITNRGTMSHMTLVGKGKISWIEMSGSSTTLYTWSQNKGTITSTPLSFLKSSDISISYHEDSKSYFILERGSEYLYQMTNKGVVTELSFLEPGVVTVRGGPGNSVVYITSDNRTGIVALYLSEHWPDPILASRENCGQSIGLAALCVTSVFQNTGEWVMDDSTAYKDGYICEVPCAVGSDGPLCLPNEIRDYTIVSSAPGADLQRMVMDLGQWSWSVYPDLPGQRYAVLADATCEDVGEARPCPQNPLQVSMLLAMVSPGTVPKLSPDCKTNLGEPMFDTMICRMDCTTPGHNCWPDDITGTYGVFTPTPAPTAQFTVTESPVATATQGRRFIGIRSKAGLGAMTRACRTNPRIKGSMACPRNDYQIQLLQQVADQMGGEVWLGIAGTRVTAVYSRTLENLQRMVMDLGQWSWSVYPDLPGQRYAVLADATCEDVGEARPCPQNPLQVSMLLAMVSPGTVPKLAPDCKTNLGEPMFDSMICRMDCTTPGHNCWPDDITGTYGVFTPTPAPTAQFSVTENPVATATQGRRFIGIRSKAGLGAMTRACRTNPRIKGSMACPRNDYQIQLLQQVADQMGGEVWLGIAGTRCYNGDVTERNWGMVVKMGADGTVTNTAPNDKAFGVCEIPCEVTPGDASCIADSFEMRKTITVDGVVRGREVRVFEGYTEDGKKTCAVQGMEEACPRNLWQQATMLAALESDSTFYTGVRDGRCGDGSPSIPVDVTGPAALSRLNGWETAPSSTYGAICSSLCEVFGVITTCIPDIYPVELDSAQVFERRLGNQLEALTESFTAIVMEMRPESFTSPLQIEGQFIDSEGVYYTLSSEPVTASQAREVCEAEGMKLACPTTKTHMYYLLDILYGPTWVAMDNSAGCSQITTSALMPGLLWQEIPAEDIRYLALCEGGCVVGSGDVRECLPLSDDLPDVEVVPATEGTVIVTTGSEEQQPTTEEAATPTFTTSEQFREVEWEDLNKKTTETTEGRSEFYPTTSPPGTLLTRILVENEEGVDGESGQLFYYQSRPLVSHAEATAACQAMSGHLACPRNALQQYAMSAVLTGEVWIGVGIEEDEWMCGGYPLTFTDWAEGHPSTPSQHVYMTTSGQWRAGLGSETRLHTICAVPCVVGETEGCLSDGRNETTVIIHSGTEQPMETQEVTTEKQPMATTEAQPMATTEAQPIATTEKQPLATEATGEESNTTMVTVDMDQFNSNMEYVRSNMAGSPGKRFIFVASDRDFFDATGQCRDRGGSLPCVSNILQQEQVLQLVSGESAWLSAIDYYEENTWECESGERFTFSNWGPSQPDNMCGSDTDADFTYISRSDGTWDDCGSNVFWLYKRDVICAVDCVVGEEEDCVVSGELTRDEETGDIVVESSQSFSSGYQQGHYFIYNETPTDFFAASRDCFDKGGWLAVPMNQAEQEYLQGLITSDAFVGVADYYEEGDFFANTGNALVYTNWAQGQPLNTYMEEDDADFVVMYNKPGEADHGQWFTRGSTTYWEHAASYICEYTCEESTEDNENRTRSSTYNCISSQNRAY
eukprot:sb/3460433/